MKRQHDRRNEGPLRTLAASSQGATRLTRLLAASLIVLATVPAPEAAQGAIDPAARKGPIVFVGSSIFHRWANLATQMAPLPVVNRAVDGLQTADLLRSLNADVVSARPTVIVYYCGSNDIDAGEPVAAIVERIRQYVERATTALPETRVIFVSINRAPEKRERWNLVDAVNHQIEADAKAGKRLQYVDVNPALFNHDGSPRMELYMPDQLHFRPPAYDEFTRILKPVLTAAFAAR